MKDHVWISSRGGRLSTMVHQPDSFRPGTPVVVCSHGFTGNKVGYNHLTVHLASYLEKLGYVVVRFDFLGSGDSDGTFAADTFVSGWREDLANVVAWVKEQTQWKDSPVILYGHSLGGLVTFLHPADARIAGRMLFAPVTKAVENFRDVILGPELWSKALQGETVANFFEKAFSLGPQFVQDLAKNQYQPMQTTAALDTPLFIVHGTEDIVVPLAGSQELYEAYSGPKELAVTRFAHGAQGHQEQLQALFGDWLDKQTQIKTEG